MVLLRAEQEHTVPPTKRLANGSEDGGKLPQMQP